MADERKCISKLTIAMGLSEMIVLTSTFWHLLLSPQCTYIIQFKRIKMSIGSWTCCVLVKYNQTNICSVWLYNIASRIE